MLNESENCQKHQTIQIRLRSLLLFNFNFGFKQSVYCRWLFNQQGSYCGYREISALHLVFSILVTPFVDPTSNPEIRTGYLELVQSGTPYEVFLWPSYNSVSFLFRVTSLDGSQSTYIFDITKIPGMLILST